MEKVEKSEKMLSEVPEELSVEVLIDQISEIKERIWKIKSMKQSSQVSKNTIQEALKSAKNDFTLMKDEFSKISSHIRLWQADLNTELKEKRKELEILYIKHETGEINESQYNKKKQAITDKLYQNDKVIQKLEVILTTS